MPTAAPGHPLLSAQHAAGMFLVHVPLLLRISRWLLKLPLCGRRCRCVATSGWCTLLGRIMRAVLACRRPCRRTLAATAAMETEVAHAAIWYRNRRRGQQHEGRAGGHRDRRSTATRFELLCTLRSQSASLQHYLRRFASGVTTLQSLQAIVCKPLRAGRHWTCVSAAVGSSGSSGRPAKVCQSTFLPLYHLGKEVELDDKLFSISSFDRLSFSSGKDNGSGAGHLALVGTQALCNLLNFIAACGRAC